MHESSTVQAQLRQKAEAVLRASDRSPEALVLLEQLVAMAKAGSDDAVFAHRHLAELLIEDHPWKAALHLRALHKAGADDDAVHGLMGLCQALLGNFQMAAAAYKKALQISPRNPWYHHNLGHLLDAAMANPAAALPHLRIAHGLEPDETEIRASLSHCLARLGHLEEAKLLALNTFGDQPENGDHAALLEWINDGAKGQGAFPVARRSKMRSRDVARSSAARIAEVAEVLAQQMQLAGYTDAHIKLAQKLWGDYAGSRGVRVVKPEVYAAALEYATMLVEGGPAESQAKVARRYGVSATALASRLSDVRDSLDLVPGDRRYRAE